MQVTINDCELINLPKIQNRAGNITPIHSFVEMPFQLKRIFYLYDVPGGESRGAHAHRKCHQFLVAASGSFEVLLNDGMNQKIVQLNRPYFGLHIHPMIWSSEINFSSGSICLVLASHFYYEHDYIRDYTEYNIEKNYVGLKFVSYDKTFLEKSWYWLNDPEIKMLTLTPDFTRDQQQEWFNSLIEMSDYKIWGIEYLKEAIGCFGLKNISHANAEYWGYIGEKKYWSIGLGKAIMEKAFAEAKKLDVKKLFLKVSTQNIRAINLYNKMGFETIDINDNIVRMKKEI